MLVGPPSEAPGAAASAEAPVVTASGAGASARAAYEPASSAVRAARRFVEEQLSLLGVPDLSDDAGLVLSELAANAVLHARTAFEVVVSGGRADGAVRVEVHDAHPGLPLCATTTTTATTGRGMLLVAALASRWGAERTDGGKVVWFEVGGEVADDAPAQEPGADELLAMWADFDAVPTVVVADVPVQAMLAAKEHMDDLVRELQIVMHDPAAVAHAAAEAQEEVRLARRLDAAVRDFEAARLQVRAQVLRASRAGQEVATLELVLAAGDGEHARRYLEVLDEAEGLSRRGLLLTRADELGQHAAVRRRYLEEVVRQLG